MSNPIVAALEQMAKRIGKTLSEDAGKAIESMYRQAGKRTEDVVKRITETDDHHAKELLSIANRYGKEESGRIGQGDPSTGSGSFAKQKLRALLDGATWPPKGAPKVEAGLPHPRHRLSQIRPKLEKKGKNSVLLPHVDVRADVEAINLGQAERVGNDFKVNGRTYGLEHNGTLFPRSGDGIVEMDRGAYGALQVMIQFHDDPERMALQMVRQSYGEAEQSLAAQVYQHLGKA